MRGYIPLLLILIYLLCVTQTTQAALNKWMKLGAGAIYSVAAVSIPAPSTFNYLFIGTAVPAAVMRGADAGVTWRAVLAVSALVVTGEPNTCNWMQRHYLGGTFTATGRLPAWIATK